MEPPRPTFAAPPVIEVVLGVQFTPLPNLSSGHLGWFWRTLGQEWDRARTLDVPPLPDQFETFERHYSPVPLFQVKLDARAGPRRLQIFNAAGDRLIQLQPTQFVYNWLKKEAAYPTFPRVYAEFTQHFSRFRAFVGETGLGEVVPNQWEVAYVDQIPRGELWETPADWHRVLPGLVGLQPQVNGLRLENGGAEWHYEIRPARGRLHLSLQQGLTEDGEAALLLQTTARGPIGKESGLDLEAGLNLGHEVATRIFMTMTSAEAKDAWGRKQP
jgi:uncharacterized protein (TIGR04255 family)